MSLPRRVRSLFIPHNGCGIHVQPPVHAQNRAHFFQWRDLKHISCLRQRFLVFFALGICWILGVEMNGWYKQIIPLLKSPKNDPHVRWSTWNRTNSVTSILPFNMRLRRSPCTMRLRRSLCPSLPLKTSEDSSDQTQWKTNLREETFNLRFKQCDQWKCQRQASW